LNIQGNSFLAEDRFFGPDPHQREIATKLFLSIADLPLICPHGHVNPAIFVDQPFSYGSPVDLLIIPDHYIFRMLYSQGIQLEKLGISRLDGNNELESDHRKIWQIFVDHLYLFHGTPTSIWFNYELRLILGIEKELTSDTAQVVYDEIIEKLRSPQFNPRRLYERFNIEVLCTTETADDPLEAHRRLRSSDWNACILPTFRPDKVINNIDKPSWLVNIEALKKVSGLDIHNFSTFITALENRRDYFKKMGAVATDHATQSPFTSELLPREAENIFQRALHGKATPKDVIRFTGHMLIEMARMSIEDGLVMQLHTGASRNHNALLFERFGPDIGADIPLQTEFTSNLHPLLNKYGNNLRLSLILFTLDETCYARELAPLAGHYPAVKLGPPWWFFDSLNGIQRYLEQVVEIAGIYNTVGFNDDTRAYLSIPARHNLWRRACVNWLAHLVIRKIVDIENAEEIAYELAYNLAKRAYRLEIS
jgi:glucuronate isomerase